MWDRDGGVMVMSAAVGLFLFLVKRYATADHGARYRRLAKG